MIDQDKIINEAALDPKVQEQKMTQWHNGTRGSAVTAMSDDKLKMNYDICRLKNYGGEIYVLEREGKNRKLAHMLSPEPINIIARRYYMITPSPVVQQQINALNNPQPTQTAQVQPQQTQQAAQPQMVVDNSGPRPVGRIGNDTVMLLEPDELDIDWARAVKNNENDYKKIAEAALSYNGSSRRILSAVLISIVLKLKCLDELKNYLNNVYSHNDKLLKIEVSEVLKNPACMAQLNKIKSELIESLEEGTEKVKDHKWVNRGEEGTHGTFKTKKEADNQRKAMFANGYHEGLEEGLSRAEMIAALRKLGKNYYFDKYTDGQIYNIYIKAIEKAKRDAEVKQDDIEDIEIKKCQKCGMELNASGECPACDLDERDLDEDVEKHEELNPKLWDGDTLKDEVKDKINQIVEEFLENLKEDEITIDVKDIVIIGSNCSYNYTKDSDLDVHIIANHIDAPEDLYDKVYSAYRSLFNKKIEIEFYGIPVEVYVQTDELPTVSNGVYSVMNDEWIKEPVKEDIPEIDKEALDKEFKVWEDRYNKIVDNSEEKLDESLNEDVNTAKSIIADQIRGEWEAISNYDKAVSELEKYNGSFQNAIDILNDIADEEEVHVGEEQKVLSELDNNVLNNIKEGEEEAEEKISEPARDLDFDESLNEAIDVTKNDSIGLKAAWAAANFREFYRKAFADELDAAFKKLKKEAFNRVKTKFECDDNEANNILVKGASIYKKMYESLNEAVENKQLNEIDKFLEDIYELRKTGLASDGEYGIGNLVFKEIRNKGYLDNLKDLRNQLVGKELSLESLEEEYHVNLSGNYKVNLKKKDLLPDTEYFVIHVTPNDESQSDMYGKDYFYTDIHEAIKDFKEAVINSAETWIALKSVIKVNDKVKEDLLAETESWDSAGNTNLDNWNNVTIYDTRVNESLDEDADLEERLDDRQRHNYRDEISRIAFNQAIIQDNGLFSIYNIKEDDVDRIVNRLRNLDYIEWVNKNASGKYDFSKVAFFGPQPRYYNITGKIKEEI